MGKERRWTKTKQKTTLFLIVGMLVVAVAAFSMMQQESSPNASSGEKLSIQEPIGKLGSIANNIVSGGPGKDGIPPIDSPKYISTSNADDFLDEGDVVFVAMLPEGAKIYPQKVLVWHEIVNEKQSGDIFSITYCPLTGSVIGYNGRTAAGKTTFGTSGKLSNSNLVMYDRETDSYFPQILGTAVTGAEKGTELELFPVFWTTWQRAKEMYPNADVLSTSTGFLRSYGRDPYGDYGDRGSYYHTGDPFFPVMHKDSRLPSKEVVVGIKSGIDSLAIQKSKLASEKIGHFSVGNVSLVAFYDGRLDVVHTFESRGKRFEIKDESIVDKETGSAWNAQGVSIDGALKGTQLEWMPSFDVMWFAWIAFYPETDLYS